MAAPGSAPPLGVLIAQLQCLAALLRDPSPSGSGVSLSALICQPDKIMQAVCRGVEDTAFFYRSDLLVNYRWCVPLLLCDPLVLSEVMREIVSAALKASGEGGIVIVSSHYGRDGFRLSVSDSSGYNPQLRQGSARDWQGSYRYRHLCALAAQIDAMGATQIASFHPDEGVVVELLFPPALCLGASVAMGWRQAANDGALNETQQHSP